MDKGAKMDAMRKLLRPLLVMATTIFIACFVAAGQGQPTINMVSYSCSSYQNGGQCQVTVSWDDPANPYPPDYLTFSEMGLGTINAGQGNSGEDTEYDIRSPAAFQLYDAQGQWLAATWCYIEPGGTRPSVTCE
jgi:hypothetical protein